MPAAALCAGAFPMSNLIYVTKCALCDPKNPFQIEEQGFTYDPGTMNGQIPERLNQFSMKLLGHIQKAATWEQKQLQRAHELHTKHGSALPDESQAKHLRHWQEFMARTALAQGSVIYAAFDTTDPDLRLMKEFARLRLNTVTRKFGFTDQMLQDAVVRLNLDEDQQSGVLTLVKAIRDALCEQGEYAPDKEQKLVSLV